MKTPIQEIFAPFKTLLPRFVWTRIRSISTAVLTPIVFSKWSGHFKSSLREKAVSSKGHPLPWYTYPSIDLLSHRDLSGRTVLEFGGGQSTLWWAARAERVITVEGDPSWHAQIAKTLPSNVSLYLVRTETKSAFLADVEAIMCTEQEQKVDVVIIDSDYREDLIDLAFSSLAENGAVICDDAESYGFYDVTKNMDVARVDFFGYSPGVVLPHCTSIFFVKQCFLFDARYPIPDMATAHY
jgi:hypothetical protein